MAYNDNTTKRKRFKHLSHEERGAIEKLLKAGHEIREIAKLLNGNTSTISREVKRGTTQQKKNRPEHIWKRKILSEFSSEGYYTHPYLAYNRWTNERMNELIRRFILKGKEISKISKEGLRRIRDW